MKTISTVNIRTALQSAPPVLDFVLPGLPAGSVGTIVGAGGIGKTTILMQLAAALATGSAAFDGLGPANDTPARVVLVAAEESADILRIRLHAIKKWLDLKPGQPVRSADANCFDLTTLLEKNLRLVPAAGQSVALVKDGAPTPFFETLGEFCSNARLIIIDPLRRLHDGDENSSSVMTAIVQVLEALATKTGAAIIVAHHIGKASMFNAVTDSAAASRGSSALTDAVRWQLNLSGMSELEAKAHRVSGQQKSYLRIDFAKANYMPPAPTLWFKRLDGGVLARVTLAGASASTGYAEQAGDIAGANTKKRRNYEW